MTSYRFIVSGKVQGVFYRKSVSEAAAAEGFEGYIKNLEDGRVEACVTLKNKERQEAFIRLLKAGSPASRVENITQEAMDENFPGGFEIRY